MKCARAQKNGEAHCDHPINSGVLSVTRGAIASHCTAHNAWRSLPTDSEKSKSTLPRRGQARSTLPRCGRFEFILQSKTKNAHALAAGGAAPPGMASAWL